MSVCPYMKCKLILIIIIIIIRFLTLSPKFKQSFGQINQTVFEVTAAAACISLESTSVQYFPIGLQMFRCPVLEPAHWQNCLLSVCLWVFRSTETKIYFNSWLELGQCCSGLTLLQIILPLNIFRKLIKRWVCVQEQCAPAGCVPGWQINSVSWCALGQSIWPLILTLLRPVWFLCCFLLLQQFLFFDSEGSRESQARWSACFYLILVCKLKEIESQAICCLLCSCQLLPGPQSRCTDARVHQSLVTERPQLLPVGREIFCSSLRTKGTQSFACKGGASHAATLFLSLSLWAEWKGGLIGRPAPRGDSRMVAAKWQAAGLPCSFSCVHLCVQWLSASLDVCKSKIAKFKKGPFQGNFHQILIWNFYHNYC